MKQLLHVSQAPAPHWVGDGFPVRSLLSLQAGGPAISPFLMLDHAGPHAFAPAERRRGVGEHPHRGFETVTIVYAGEVEHRDSGGNAGRIGPGDVQWMTAARGVMHDEFHSEAFTRSGGTLEMVQLWVNLPARDKMGAPRYQALTAAEIPVVALEAGAGTARVIAGALAGTRGPAATHTPLAVWDLRVRAGAAVALPLPAGWNALLVVLHGSVHTGGRRVGAGSVAHYAGAGETLAFDADEDAVLLLLAGEPIDEPVAQYGPFVMNTEAELRQALEDLRAGRFARLPAGADERA